MKLKSLEELLSSASANSEEYHFYYNGAELLNALVKPITQNEAFALLSALELSEIKFRDGRLIGFSQFIGGIEDWSRVFAVCLPEISQDPIWWKANFANFLGVPEVSRQVPGMKQKVESLSFIEHVHW